jgi:hypothetical protein
VLIGGGMGTGSYVLVGGATSESKSFSSACHGAGRALSRHAAIKQWSGRKIVDDLASRGILIDVPALDRVSAPPFSLINAGRLHDSGAEREPPFEFPGIRPLSLNTKVRGFLRDRELLLVAEEAPNRCRGRRRIADFRGCQAAFGD